MNKTAIADLLRSQLRDYAEIQLKRERDLANATNDASRARVNADLSYWMGRAESLRDVLALIGDRSAVEERA